MNRKIQALPVVGLLATAAVAAYIVVQLDGQEKVTGDFSKAANAEVRDAHGQVLLRGQFAVVDEEDDDIERKATLQPTDVDPDAGGEAEVEHSKTAPAEQEVEFAVRNLQPALALTFVIDGVEVAKATTDGRGRAEVELAVRTAR